MYTNVPQLRTSTWHGTSRLGTKILTPLTQTGNELCVGILCPLQPEFTEHYFNSRLCPSTLATLRVCFAIAGVIRFMGKVALWTSRNYAWEILDHVRTQLSLRLGWYSRLYFRTLFTIIFVSDIVYICTCVPVWVTPSLLSTRPIRCLSWNRCLLIIDLALFCVLLNAQSTKTCYFFHFNVFRRNRIIFVFDYQKNSVYI